MSEDVTVSNRLSSRARLIANKHEIVNEAKTAAPFTAMATSVTMFDAAAQESPARSAEQRGAFHRQRPELARRSRLVGPIDLCGRQRAPAGPSDEPRLMREAGDHEQGGSGGKGDRRNVGDVALERAAAARADGVHGFDARVVRVGRAVEGAAR